MYFKVISIINKRHTNNTVVSLTAARNKKALSNKANSLPELGEIELNIKLELVLESFKLFLNKSEHSSQLLMFIFKCGITKSDLTKGLDAIIKKAFIGKYGFKNPNYELPRLPIAGRKELYSSNPELMFIATLIMLDHFNNKLESLMNNIYTDNNVIVSNDSFDYLKMYATYIHLFLDDLRSIIVNNALPESINIKKTTDLKSIAKQNFAKGITENTFKTLNDVINFAEANEDHDTAKHIKIIKRFIAGYYENMLKIKTNSINVSSPNLTVLGDTDNEE